MVTGEDDQQCPRRSGGQCGEELSGGQGPQQTVANQQPCTVDGVAEPPGPGGVGRCSREPQSNE